MEREWMAIVSVMGGAGSYARGKSKEEVVTRVKKILKQDWKSLVDFKKGTVIKANVFEFEGDEVTWDHSISVDGKPYDGKVEMVEITY